MTRILRLLMIAAIALPLWQPMAAQEVDAPRAGLKGQEALGDLISSSEKSLETIIVETPKVRSKAANRGTSVMPIVVADGTTTNQYLPVYGYYFEQTGNDYRYQMIYPATMLVGLKGGKIKSITFHTSTGIKFGNPNGRYGTGDLKLTVGTIGQTSFQNNNFVNFSSIATKTITPVYNDQDMTFEFDVPFEYPDGTNLIFETQVTEAGQYDSTDGATKFYGANQTNYCSYGYGSGGWSSSSRKTFLPKVTFEVEFDDTEALDFGDVEVGTTSTLPANISNPGNEAVTATLSTTAPFTVSPTTVSIGAGGVSTVDVSFTPTVAKPYSGNLVVTINGNVMNIPLRGVGNVNGKPEAIRDSTFFAGITYDWTDAEGSHISRLDEIATKPEQMIAMLRTVYMDPSIPGNLIRGFTSTGGDDSGNIASNQVQYTAAGTLVPDGDGVKFEDTYGWNIPCDQILGDNKSYEYSNASYDLDYWYMNPYQYRPDYEGVTLLLVEMVDDFSPTNIYEEYDEDGNGIGEPILKATVIDKTKTGYDLLKEYFSKSIKSVRIISHAKRTGEGQEAGTLFKIDCDKMNKFYLLAKGQLQWHRVMLKATVPEVGTDALDFYHEPCYLSGYWKWNATSDQEEEIINFDSYEDPAINEYFFLGHMFEQFSPAISQTGEGNTGALDDIYKDLINQQSFGVIHDCPNVPFVGDGHHFMMYGPDSKADDCADVRDMMFFVPDYRMMDWDERGYYPWTLNDGTRIKTQDYFMYHQNHKPQIGLYVIRQDSIQGEPVQDKEMYKLTLTWDSNLDEYLPSDQQVYELLQVVVDENGVEQYVPVYYMNSNGDYTDKNGNVVTTPVPIKLTLNPDDPKTYTEVYVPMQESSQQVTYAVRGQDITEFLDLKTSNKRDYIIPGLDPTEMVALKDVIHYSRFDPETVKNCYSNRLSFVNNALGLNNNYITEGENGTKLEIKRVHTESVNGENTTVAEVIATITFNNHNNAGRSITITMDKQSPKSEYPNGMTSGEGAGYHPNPITDSQNNSWTQTYSIVEGGNNAGNIIFNPAINIYDNFVVDVSENTHPNSYSYQLTSNYTGKAVYLNASACANGEEDWYAWTWPTNGNGRWVQGKGTKQKLMFCPVDDNINFVRLQKGNTPNWDNHNLWNETGNKQIEHEGDTYILSGYSGYNMNGAWAGEVSTAYSNDFRIPIFKTDSRINSIFTKDQVDGDKDGYMELPENLKFDAKVHYSSKTEILRYDAYRWDENEIRYIVDEVGAEDAEQDIAPTGMATNQDGSYTVSMNKVGTDVYYTSSVTTPANDSGEKWAEFVDYVPSDTIIGAAFTYAPVVELFTYGKNEYNKERDDYNTYGGPLQTAAVAKLQVSVVEPTPGNPSTAQMSDYVWEDGTDENGYPKKYTYYTIKLSVDQKSVPAGYDIYRISAWREIDEDLTGEQYEVCEGRRAYPYRFENLTYPDYDKTDTTYVLGSGEDNLDIEGHVPIEGNCTGTFGARKVRTEKDETGVIEDLTMCLYVRIYFTRKANLPQNQSDIQGAPRLRADEQEEPNLPADGKYYVAEQIIDYVIEGNENGIPTGVVTNLNVKQVVSEKYYNVAGIASDTPFQGVNIVVTRYSDGSTTTTKILK